MRRVLSTVFVVGVILNFVWEMAQASFYHPMGTFGQAVFRCFLASIGDGLMIMLIGILGAALFRSFDWFDGVDGARLLFAGTAGLIVALVVEWWGLQTGRWEYNTQMPTVPGTPFGIVPLAQMVLLTPTTLWIASRFSRDARTET